MATQFLKVCLNFHPNYGCSLQTWWIKIWKCKINNETSELFFTCLMVKISSMYSLGTSRVWRSNWYYADIYRDSAIPPGMDWWWVLPFGKMPISIFKFVPLRRMLHALKKGEDFKSLTEWAEYNFRELWVRYFSAQTIGVVATMLVPRPWCRDSPFSCAYL
jgi:hypothetical protein